MNTTRQFKLNTKTKQTAVERLSSGFRINRAADDAAGLAISEKMRAQIRGLHQGSRNVQDGISFCNVADGALNEVHAILGRIRELAVQAASDTYVEQDRQAIEDEFTQLKDEINRISRTTEFNTKRIFDDGVFKVEFSDDICPIKIFNANHGSPTAPETYGGIILGDDTRIAWNAIDPSMVTKDALTGETVFKKGEYEYKTNEYKFTITCEEGSKPPEIKVEFEVSASGDGIHIAGDLIAWEDVVNENEESILDHLGEEGHYHFKDREGTGSFYVEEGAMLGDIIKALNEYNERTHTRYYNIYDSYYITQAVDVADTGTLVRITQDLYTKCFKDTGDIDLNIHLQADKDGIWVKDWNNQDIPDSKKTWAELGLAEWSSGNQVSDKKTYAYTYQSSDGVYDITFEFFLLDETSKDSVIDGINNMELEDWSNYGDTDTSFTLGQTGNILSGKLDTHHNTLTVKEQAMLGRDFDKQNETFASTWLTYDFTSDYFFANLYNPDNRTQSIGYVDTSPPKAATIERDSADTVSYLTAKALRQLLTGISPDVTLTDIIGADHSTQSGYFSETYTVTADTRKTNGLAGGTYASAHIDFSGLGTEYQLYDLIGTGFDSAAIAQEKHSGILFTYGDSTETTAGGYGYSLKKNSIDNTLCIDLKTLAEQGVTDGISFTNALVEILDAPRHQFDLSFTQYATNSSDGKLYICDKRTTYLGRQDVKNSSFVTTPQSADSLRLDFDLRDINNSSRSVFLSYQYDIDALLTTGIDFDGNTDISNHNIRISLTEDTDGLYIKNTNNLLELYRADDYLAANGQLKPGITSLPKRYNITTSTNIDWNTIHETIMNEITAHDGFSVTSTDYAYLRCTTDENPNDAYVSTFRFQREKPKDEGMWIQAGANQFQGLFIKWDGFSSHTLGLSYLSMTDRDEAGKLITRTDHAIEKISRIRSAFGAYTNRMEHIMNMNENYAENLHAAESGLRDTDMAEEFVSFSKANIISQATQSMLSQAIRQPDGLLQLLQ